MTKFYVADIETQQPEGINGYYMERIKDKVFEGFIRSRSTGVKGIGQVTFTDRIVCDVINSAFEIQGVDASIEFRIEQDSVGIYIAEVDFNNYSVNHKGFITVGFRDEGGVSVFDSNLDKEYELTANKSIFIPKTNLVGMVSHSVDEALNVLQSSKNYGSVIATGIPLKVKNKDSVGGGIGLDVKDTSTYQPFWTNSTDRTVRINVGAYFEISSTSDNTCNVSFTLIQRQAGVIQNTISVYSYSSSSTLSIQTIVIDEFINVPVGGDVVLWIKGDNDTQSYSITINKGDVSVTEDLDIKGSSVSCIKVSDAIRQLVALSSDGLLTVQDEVFKNEYLTNGFCLRGADNVLKVSLLNLFVGLSKLFNLVLNIDNGIVKIQKKEVRNKNGGASILVEDYKIESIISTTATAKYVNQIKVGCDIWQSDTVLGNEEYNSNRTYQTGIKKTKESLDRTIKEFSISGKIIEKVRRQQNEILLNNQKTDTKYDDTLFLIDSDGSAATVGLNGLNERFNPIEQLNNLSFEYGHCGDFSFLNGNGNTTGVVLGNKQNKTIVGNKYFTGRMIMVEGICSLNAYLSLQDKAFFDFNGSDTTILIENDSYRIQTNKFTIQGYEIQ